MRTIQAGSVVSLTIAVLALTGCSAEPAAPETVRIMPRVESQYGPVLNMELDAGRARSGAVIAAAGDAVLQIGRDMIAGKPPAKGEIDAINFTVLGGAKAGSTDRKVAHFSLGGQELRQLVHAGATGATILDSARDVGSWAPANADVINAYCADRGNAPFCTQAK